MKHILFLSILWFFSPTIICSEQTHSAQPLAETIKDFFPIEASYQRIVMVSNTNQFLHNQYPLYNNAKQLLKESQRNTYGFCYAGMLNNSNDPTLALINHQYPYFLNLQIYKLPTSYQSQTLSLVLQRSKTIDPTFYPHITKKQPFSYNSEFFWQTIIYRHTKIGSDTKFSSSSFWGPFFTRNNEVGCFFYTNLSSNYMIYENGKDPYIEKHPPYTISYHTIDISGKEDHKICYISPNGLTCYPLYAHKNRYLTLLLATFFPSKDIEEKKIFFTNKYSIQELSALKIYINSFQEKPLMLSAELKKRIKNKTIYTLLLHSLVHKTITKDFYTEINRTLSFLINLRQNSQSMI